MLSSSWKKCKSHDCLYNKYSKSYKDKYIKINYWKKIGEKFDMSAADAEKKFENVKPQTDRVKYEPSGGRQRRRSVTTVSVNKERQTKNKNPVTAAIIWKHRIATIAQNKSFVSNTFFDDSRDSSDGSDYIETRL